jgi:hypothetical protein
MNRPRLIRALTLILVMVLVALMPLAYGEPPDPTWMSGWFDDDDDDNGVFLITSSTATLDPFPVCSWAPIPVHSPAIVWEDRSPASPQYFSTADARASPIA